MCAALLVALLLLPYAVVVCVCAAAVRRASSAGVAPGAGGEAVSVVVCVSREEVPTLRRCLASLARAMRQGDTVVVVADHCDAAVAQWLADEWGRRPGFRVIANSGPRGKKSAQRQGVAAVATRAVLSVDADCVVDPGALDAVRRCVPAQGGFMLLLPVFMAGGGGLFGRMVEMEFVCLQVVTAGSARLGCPTMANGAGMAFCRSLYMTHDARADYASGDDMFLLAEARRRRLPVRFVFDRQALVRTAAPATVSGYLRQRVRWLSKAGGYSAGRGGGATVALAWCVLAAVVAFPLAAALAVCGVAGWWLAAGAFLSKLAVDVAAFAAGRRLWPSAAGLWVGLPLEALYPVMTAVVALRAAFSDRRAWG